MKRLAAALLAALVLLVSFDAAEDIDLSGLSFDQLVTLRERVNRAIWDTKEWKEVNVPAGVYEVGRDIPDGFWTVTAAGEFIYMFVTYCKSLDETGLGPNVLDKYAQRQLVTHDLIEAGSPLPASVNIRMRKGWFLITDAAVVITTGTGFPAPGFI